MSKLATITACVILGILGLSPFAYAHDGHHAAEEWQLRQIGPDLVWVDAEESHQVDAHTIVLTKPAGDVGTSAETPNLDLAVETGDVVTVEVSLTDGATAAAGAVRLFVYDHAGANTLTEAPTVFSAATGDGTLSLVIPFDGKIGTMGLVYDASNPTTGDAVFSDLEVAGTPISFDPAPRFPEPTGTARTCEAPGFITIPENDYGVTYEIDGDPYEAGTFAFPPGTYEVTAAGTAWAVTVAAETEACPGKDGDPGVDGQDGKDASPIVVPTLIPAGVDAEPVGVNPLVVAVVALVGTGLGIGLLILTAPPKGRYAAPRR